MKKYYQHVQEIDNSDCLQQGKLGYSGAGSEELLKNTFKKSLDDAFCTYICVNFA